MELLDRFGAPLKKPSERRLWGADIFEVIVPVPPDGGRVQLQVRVGTKPDGSPAGVRFGIEPELALQLAEALRKGAGDILKAKAEEKFGAVSGPAGEEEVIA